MLKISKKVSYIIVAILTFIYLLLAIFASMEYIDVVMVSLYMCIFPMFIYILYLFVPIKRKYAYLHGFISSLIISIVSTLPYYIKAVSAQHANSIKYGVPIYADSTFIYMLVTIILLILIEALFGGIIHLVDYCVRKLVSKIKKK